MEDLSIYNFISTEQIWNDLRETQDELICMEITLSFFNDLQIGEIRLTDHGIESKKDKNKRISFLKSLLKYRGINV